MYNLKYSGLTNADDHQPNLENADSNVQSLVLVEWSA